jgi:hypothetical protein
MDVKLPIELPSHPKLFLKPGNRWTRRRSPKAQHGHYLLAARSRELGSLVPDFYMYEKGLPGDALWIRRNQSGGCGCLRYWGICLLL